MFNNKFLLRKKVFIIFLCFNIHKDSKQLYNNKKKCIKIFLKCFDLNQRFCLFIEAIFVVKIKTFKQLLQSLYVLMFFNKIIYLNILDCKKIAR